MLSKLWKTFVAVFGAALFSLTTSAGTVDPRVAKSDVCGPYEILHVNGINTAIEGARENLRELSVRFGNSHEEHLIRYGLAYNQTDWFLADLQQTYAQLLASYPGISYRQWLRAVFSGIWPDSLPAEAIAEIGGSIGTLMGLNRPSPYYDSDLNRMVSEIRAVHSQDGRMVMVGHSQGTIYANFLYDRLTSPPLPILIPADRLAIVGVAAVTESLRGGGSHVNSQRDMVVNLVRLVVPNTLRANVTLPNFAADIIGHNFIAVYLAYTTSREAIVGRIQTALTSLASGVVSPVVSPVTYMSLVWSECAGSGCTRDVNGQRVVFQTPLIQYVIPGSASPYEFVYQPGSLQNALDLAVANTAICYQLTLTEQLRRRSVGDMSWVRAPFGCWDTLSAPNGVWHVYSGDGPGEITPFYSTFFGNVTTTAGATCRRSA